jgi:ABC-type branched-subunit amino acid transport system permease subunit
VPEGSVFHLSDYAVALVGKIMCYAICALAMDLIWGYTGILSAWATACSLHWVAMPWACT